MKGLAPILVMILLSLILAGGTVAYIALEGLPTSNDYVFNGSTVYINNDDLYLSASPHTISNSGDVMLELVSKQYNGQADLILGFDYPDVRPTSAEYFIDDYNESQSYTCSGYAQSNSSHFACYTNNTATKEMVYWHSYTTKNGATFSWTDTYDKWITVSNRFDYIDYEHEGMSRWYYTTFDVTAEKLYRLKLNIQLPMQNNETRKYWVCIKPHSETIEQAQANGHLYCLDPWYLPATYTYRYRIYENKTYAWETAVNDTDGVGLAHDIIWARTSNESYVYSTGSGTSGTIVIANETDQKYWENETSLTGNSPTLVWDSSAQAVWHLGESAGTAQDSSAYNNDASNDTATLGAAGKYGYAHDFNNVDDYVGVPDSASLSPTGDLVITGWIYPDTIGVEDYIVNKDLTGKRGYYIELNQPAGNLMRFLVNSGAASMYIDSSAAVSTGSWTSFVVIYDTTGATSRMELWLNGVNKTGTLTGSVTSINDNNVGFRLGADQTTANLFDGKMDEMRVYNDPTQWTAARIRDHYYSGYGNLTATGTQEAVTTPTVTISSPSNTTYYVQNINFNATVSVDASWCGFELDNSGSNTTMSNTYRFGDITSMTAFGYAYTGLTTATHLLEISCNSTTGLSNVSNVTFTVLDGIKLYNNITDQSDLAYDIYETMDTNITVVNKTGVGTVYIEINGTNYTATALDTVTEGVYVGNKYNYAYQFNSSNVGTHTVRQYAYDNNDTIYKTNSSSYFNITVSKWSNNSVNLSASDWSLEYGETATVTCTAEVGTPTFTKDGAAIVSPYSAMLGIGSYSFVCTIPESTNYTSDTDTHTLTVTETTSGCTNSSTFIYNSSINLNGTELVLNFTDLVDAHLIRSDLGDVMTTTSGILLNVNFTGADKYIVLNTNSTGSAILKYGNYYVNSPPSNISITNASLTSFTSTSDAPYYYMTIVIDEMSLNIEMPQNTTERVTLYCNGGSQEFNISHADSSFAIPTFRILEQMELTARYSADELYFRDLLYDSAIEYRTMYMADGVEYQIVQYVIQLQDNTGEYTDPEIHIKKLIGSSWVTITERPFDIENKAIVYLISGQQYQLSVTSGLSETVIGNLQADTVNLVKTVVLQDVPVTNSSIANVSKALTWDNTTGTIQFIWRDDGHLTTLSEMSVYNYSNTSQLMYYANSTNTSYVTFSYTVPTLVHKYKVDIEVHHERFGENTFTMSEVFGTILGFEIDMGSLSDTQISIICTIFFIMLILLFSPVQAGTGAVIVSIFGVLLTFIGIYPANPIVMTVALVLAILNKFIERKVES